MPDPRWSGSGHVAAVQFSRAAERCAPGDSRHSAVSQNSTACSASSSTMCGTTRKRGGISKKGDPAGPARFGRRTRPHGRRSSLASPRGHRSAGAGPAMTPCHEGPLKGLPRKEVIQPQLPLRLPCYDFTPVTSPTFDGSLPCGLGHRLRVLLTPVV
jgi:hypothetical protein